MFLEKVWKRNFLSYDNRTSIIEGSINIKPHETTSDNNTSNLERLHVEDRM